MSETPAWARLRANRPAMFGLFLVLATLAWVAFVPLVSPHGPDVSDFRMAPGPSGGAAAPSLSHPLGTDALYRDLLARLAAGGRLSLSVALAATTLALAIGTSVGVLAGLTSRTRLAWVDGLLVRLIEIALAFPYLLLVTAVGVLLERATPMTIALILGLSGWVGLARLVRARTLEIAASDHVLAARALGVPPASLVKRHVLPGLRGLLLVTGSQTIGQMVLAEAVLGYLTVGVGPPQASWGRMLQEAEPYLGFDPRLVGAPAFAILLTVFGFSRVADGLADAAATRPSGAHRGRVPVDALVLGAVLALVVGFSGTANLAAPLAQPTTPARVLRIATAHSLGPLDPALANDELTLAIDELIHARLLRHSAAGDLVGELAESLRPEPGSTRFVLALRAGARFHDGTPVLAAAVKRSLERALHPDTPCPAASAYRGLLGFNEFRARRAVSIAGIVVIDARHLRFDLESPDAAFPALLTLGFAAPVCDDGHTHADPSTPPPCGAGPFRFVRRDDVLVELARVDAEASPTAAFHGLLVHLGVPARTQRYRFERGELDILTEINGVDAQRFEADSRWREQIRWSARPSVEGIYLDTHRPPFDDRHLRRAVALALEPEVLGRLRPNIAAIDRILPPGTPRAEEVVGRRHDRTAALEEMKLAGYPFDPATGRGGYPSTIGYMTIASSFDQAAAEVYVQQLAAIGLRVEIVPVTYASWLATLGTSRAPAMGWRGWIPDFPDPAGVIDPLLLTSAIAEGKPTQNASFFSNPEVDRLAADARREQDVPRRLGLYAAIEQIVREEAPWIPSYSIRAFTAWHPYIGGVQFDGTGRLALANLHLRDAGERTP
ncbi:MAG: ABC transporter permease subunit [Deltaproteobacteria bacterium]|nr:ABC transporter permease subunit [Deltaproteobacteria bacterium]